jgi:hypothetical protein
MAGGDVVNVPFFGEQRKEYLIAGGAVAAGYLGWKALKKRGSGAPSTGAGALSGTAAQGTFVGYDATGAPVYQNASGQDVDANGNPDTVVTPAGTAGGGYTNPAPITVSGTQNTGAGSAPQTDQAWTQAVEADLTGVGYDPQTVATAVAQYLASQPLTAAQITIIRTAWAYEGRPPQHPNLPTIAQQNPPAGGGGGGTQKKLPAVGQVIEVDYLVQGTGQSWNSIAAKYGISGAHLAQNNGKAVTTTPTGVIKVPVLIKPGMTAASIAASFGISEQHLLDMVGV